MAVFQTTLQNVIDKYFPSEYYRGGTYLTAVGILSTLISIFIKLFTPISVNRFPEAIMVLTFLIAIYQQRKTIKPGMTALLITISIVMPIVFFGINYLRDPVTAVKYMDLDKLVKLFMFVPVAWWLGGKLDNWLKLMVVFFVGLMIAILTNPALPSAINAINHGDVPQFGLRNHQHEAVYFGIIFISSVIFLGKIIASRNIFQTIVWLIILSISLLGVIITQARAIWLGVVISLIIFCAYNFLGKERKFLLRKVITYSVLTGCISAFCLVIFSSTIETRMLSEDDLVIQLIQGDIDNIPYTSVGTRVNSWIDALGWIKERPFIGWGLWARKDVIELSQKAPDWAKKQWGHLHNSYIEITIAYGIIGLVFVFFVFSYLFIISISSTNHLIYRYTLAIIVFIAIINMFESYMVMWNGIYVLSLVLSLPYTFSYKSRKGFTNHRVS